MLRRPRPPVLLLVVAALVTPAFTTPADGTAGEVPAGHVVVLDPTVTDVATTASTLLAPFGARPGFVYEHALRGFSADLTPRQVATLSASPLVSLVERDRLFTPASSPGVTVPTGVSRVGAAGSVGTRTRIDADVAVLDTGLDADQPDLRVHRRVDCVRPVRVSSSSWLSSIITTSDSSQDREECAPDRGDDDTGHGTHVAGVIGAKDDGHGVVGVAPGVRLWGVKVLDVRGGGGSTKHILAGLDFVTQHSRELEVVNMSFVSDGRSEAVDEAITRATQAGLVVVVAAGNAAKPASWFTPANAPKVITVSAISDLDGRPGALAQGDCDGGDDRFATYSNYGHKVTIAAPGSCILSTAVGGGTARYSGTSVAAPHVAGAAARHIAATGELRRTTRWQRTRDAILARSAAQTGPCGFAGGRSAEPLLRLTGC